MHRGLLLLPSACGTGCNTCTASCQATECTGGGNQDVIFSKAYTVSGATNIRLHFSDFDVEDGTTATDKDYVELKLSDDTVIDTLTGQLGAHWTRWANADWSKDEDTIEVVWTSDNNYDAAFSGITIDELEYTDATNGGAPTTTRTTLAAWRPAARATALILGVSTGATRRASTASAHSDIRCAPWV